MTSRLLLGLQIDADEARGGYSGRRPGRGSESGVGEVVVDVGIREGGERNTVGRARPIQFAGCRTLVGRVDMAAMFKTRNEGGREAVRGGAIV